MTTSDPYTRRSEPAYAGSDLPFGSDISGSEKAAHDINDPYQGKERVRALLLDSDPYDRQNLLHVATACRQLSISVVPCESVDEALTALSSARFDVIYVEYWLGVETSIPFIHSVALQQLSPCIVVTDLNEPDIRRVAFRAGAQAFLAKDSLSPQALEGVTLAVLRPQLSVA